MPALSFVFFTNELHVLPLATLQIEQPPPSIKITKHFFQTHIEELKSEFFRVHSMGTATAEEWIKGLEERGKERRNDAGRWEKWEASGGVTRMRGLDSHKSIRSALLTRTAAPSTIGMPILHTSKGHNPVLSNNSISAPMSSQVRKLSQPLQTSFRK
jgi:hypothetical protein